MHRTQSFLNEPFHTKNIHSKSMNNFVLLNRNRQVQQNYQWRPLRIKEAILQRTNSLNRQISFGGSYSNKKSILVTLNRGSQTYIKNTPRSKVSSSSNKFIDTDALLKSKLDLDFKSTDKNQLPKSSHSQRDNDQPQNRLKMEQKLNRFTNKTDCFNRKVEKNIESYKTAHSSHQKQNVNSETGIQLQKRIQRAYSLGQRVIGILIFKKYGMRMRLKHSFSEMCMCKKKLHQAEHKLENNAKIQGLVKQMLNINQKEERPLYYFHLNKQPISSTNELPIFESVILASSSPILNIENEFHFKVYEEAQKIEQWIKSIQSQLNLDFENIQQSTKSYLNQQKYLSHPKKVRIEEESLDDEHNQTTKYDWQIINSIEGYVDKLVENPESMRPQFQNDPTKNPSLKCQIRTLYNETFENLSKIQTGENFRNPLLQDHSHYHQELKHKNILSVISSKLQRQHFIKNKHIIKRPTIEALIQQKKQQHQRQKQEESNPNILQRNITNTLKSKKSVIKQLDQKNALLFEQNIPYLMDKYGISRYEIHNLFTIYKTLEKISAMKLHSNNQTRKVMEKGIDRQTFDQGMKRLDINPGDEVIKNICYFDDFISWEQFIKIVSIGLRKTPEQKLEAILIGIGGTNNGHLSKNQISIMIGNSLNKIFDSQQTELREYFTQMAMRDLDSDNSGCVDVNQIKGKCLNVEKVDIGKGENLDLVTFLLLNS